MKRIVVASKNPVKLKATAAGFHSVFPDETFEIHAISVSSDVPDQPLSDETTRQGAEQRTRHAMAASPDADYWVGIEGGISDIEGMMAAFAWIVIRSAAGTGKARTGTFFLPEAVADLVRQGEELGVADDIVFGRINSKQECGAVGLLTGNVIDRIDLYQHAVALALIPFIHRNLFAPSTP